MKYYLVGGYVRDELLGIKSKDIDFAVEAYSYEEMKEDILVKGYKIFQERPQYFSIRGWHPDYGGVDFTLCRKDGFYSDSRRPDTVEIGTIYDDLARRDFTINAIAKTEDGGYIDPYYGRVDLENKLLLTVGDPYDRFTEDPLRILRAVRFHITKGFKIAGSIDKFFYDPRLINKIETLPVERIYEELKKCFEHDTWETLEFFSNHKYLSDSIFYGNKGLALVPFINHALVAQ